MITLDLEGTKQTAQVIVGEALVPDPVPKIKEAEFTPSLYARLLEYSGASGKQRKFAPFPS